LAQQRSNVKSPIQGRYLIKSLLHACAVLQAFQPQGEPLRLRDIVSRTGLKKGMCFRLLYTLREGGFIDKVGENQYRLLAQIGRHRKYRLGYAAQGYESSFAREVLEGLSRAAETEDIELLVVDNRYNAKAALHNADYLLHEGVDLIIEFQTFEAVAPAIGSKYLEAGVPFIAVEIPHPGATYFGANNYAAGLIGGRHLGRWARKQWEGGVDEILMITIGRAGPVPHGRIQGMVAGIHEVMPPAEHCPTFFIDGDGQFKATLERVRRHLRQSKAKHVLVGGANDPSALGALRAFEETGRERCCAIVGQNGEPDMRNELRALRRGLIGSVGYFPEKYGDGLIRLALDILAKKSVPPAIFIRHELIVPENVDHLYPNDRLLNPA
jgi:ribose transport system substrate-binding protein